MHLRSPKGKIMHGSVKNVGNDLVWTLWGSFLQADRYHGLREELVERAEVGEVRGETRLQRLTKVKSLPRTGRQDKLRICIFILHINGSLSMLSARRSERRSGELR